MKIKINVTAEIIATAMEPKAGVDIIAESLKSWAAQNGWRISKVQTDILNIRFTDSATKRKYIAKTPQEARKAWIQFDSGEKPEPFSFTLAAHERQ